MKLLWRLVAVDPANLGTTSGTFLFTLLRAIIEQDGSMHGLGPLPLLAVPIAFPLILNFMDWRQHLLAFLDFTSSVFVWQACVLLDSLLSSMSLEPTLELP